MKNIKHFGLSFSVFIVIMVVWILITGLGIFPEVLMPSPIRVVKTFINLTIHGYNGIPLYMHYFITIMRLFIAVSIALFVGTLGGLISGYVSKISAVIDPIIQFIRPIPPLAYYTLLILWFGIGEFSKVLLLFLAALPPIYLSSYDGVRKINPEFIQSAASLGASRKQIFTEIVFKATLPDIFTGTRSAIGVAYTTIVSAEMIASSSGLGWMVIDASHYLKSDVMFVGIIILGVTGVMIDAIVKIIQIKIVHWSGKQ